MADLIKCYRNLLKKIESHPALEAKTRDNNNRRKIGNSIMQL